MFVLIYYGVNYVIIRSKSLKENEVVTKFYSVVISMVIIATIIGVLTFLFDYLVVEPIIKLFI